MPLPSFMVLIALVVTAAGGTILLAYALGINFAWLGLVAAILALAIRRFAR